MLVINRLKPCSNYISPSVTSVSSASPPTHYICVCRTIFKMNGSNRPMRTCVWDVTLSRWITVPQPLEGTLLLRLQGLRCPSITWTSQLVPSSSGAEASKYYLDVSIPEDEGSKFLRTVGERQSSNTVRRVVKI